MMKNWTIGIVSLVYFGFNFGEITLGGHKITLPQVEDIMGEKCVLLEEESSQTQNGHIYKSSFEVLNKEILKNRFFFMFESYENDQEALKVYDSFFTENSNSKGFENISTSLIKTFYHTDNQNFALLIILKNNELIRLKVYKISTKYSKANLIEIGKLIANRI